MVCGAYINLWHILFFTQTVQHFMALHNYDRTAKQRHKPHHCLHASATVTQWSSDSTAQNTVNKQKPSRLVGRSLTSLFSTNIRDERSGVESYWTQWRKASDILTSTLAAFLFSSHPKSERGQGDQEARLNYYAIAYNRGRQLLHHKTKLNQIQQNTRINLN